MGQGRGKAVRWGPTLVMGAVLLGGLFVAFTGSLTLGGALLACVACGYKLGSYVGKG